MNKNAELTMRQIVMIIICIIILLAILMFIVKFNILEWLRSLPDYTYGKDEPVDYTDMSPEQLAALGCFNKIAELSKGDTTSFWQDFGYTDVREIVMLVGTSNGKTLNLHFIYNDKDQSFLIKVFNKNIDVGNIKNRNLVITDFDKPSNEGYVSSDDLSLLDDSRLYGRLLCKTDEQMNKIPVRREILGETRDVFLNDAGKCTVDLGNGGKYGLQDGKLFYYEGGKWKDVDNEIPTEEQVKEAVIINKLREKEKELLSLVLNSKVCTKALGTYLGMGYSQADVTKWCFMADSSEKISDMVKEIGQGENLDDINYLDEHSDFVALSIPGKGDLTASFSNLNSYVGESKMNLLKEDGKIYLWSREGNYAVRGEKVHFFELVAGNYKWGFFDISGNPFVSKSGEELDKMKNWGGIKQSLIAACGENVA